MSARFVKDEEGTDLCLECNIPWIAPLVPEFLHAVTTDTADLGYGLAKDLAADAKFEWDIRRLEMIGQEVDGAQQVLWRVVCEKAEETRAGPCLAFETSLHRGKQLTWSTFSRLPSGFVSHPLPCTPGPVPRTATVRPATALCALQRLLA